MDDQDNISFEGELEKSKGGYQITMEEKMPPHKKDRFLPISILIAAVMICGAVVFAVLYHPSASPSATPPNPAAIVPSATTTAQIMTIGPRDEVLGSPNAPVTIVEYGDYQCPFCTAFFSQTQPLIISNYVNTGKVKMVFRNFAFLGPESTAAAQAAECAFDQKKLWPYHDALYQSKVTDEANGGSEDDGSLNRTLFLSIAQKLNLDMPTFTSCLDSNKYATTVTQEKAAATAAGVNSTPTFFVNGTEVLGAEPYAQFEQAIDTADVQG